MQAYMIGENSSVLMSVIKEANSETSKIKYYFEVDGETYNLIGTNIVISKSSDCPTTTKHYAEVLTLCRKVALEMGDKVLDRAIKLR